ncbi:D-galactoside/L-rhamnose binding SUEL lectin domain [Macleaya cordata]|uniref:Beta-galactosidase n=1 Tax=Macleaya cordata TaxID=56857 RepID=A0A200RA60_MACCD|nr:D-galactoside/L-rhamnose binding SUEL lectin domain [Macleaya cordata]
MVITSRLLLLTLLSLWIVSVYSDDDEKLDLNAVTYDGRSLMINGRRELFFSGSIHYPRSPPDMWPDIINKAKHGGLNVIQTYVFWNIHEPVQGQFNFEGKYDIVKFIKLIQQNGMYVVLRIGPFIEAEWNFGGFPYWLREVKNITFRADEENFKFHMKQFTEMIIKRMKDAKLFASQGGPIILAQIENEYNNVQLAYKTMGTRYVQWAGTMAVGLKTGVPWVMCKQKDAPDPVINTCNGRNCGDTFTGPNRPNKPSLWTENWTAQYRVFGDPPSQRSAEDLAFSVARFFSKNGTLANYYMYYGGTNFGRTASSFVTTRYYDEAPLDEYGLQKEPKWGHLRDLHSALRLCKKALLFGTKISVENLGDQLEARIYEKPGTNVCAAFLCNNHTREPTTATFRGVEYYLPAHSISILPDCKTVVYNTQTMQVPSVGRYLLTTTFRAKQVVAQHNARTFHKSEVANKDIKWEMSHEKIPTVDEAPIKFDKPLELLAQTKDTTDYLWYTTRIDVTDDDLPRRKDILPVIQVANLGHAMHAFVNGEYIGSGHGNNIDKSFSFRKPINLKPGTNDISLLGMTVGLPVMNPKLQKFLPLSFLNNSNIGLISLSLFMQDSGAYLEHRMSGVHAVSIQGLNTGTVDLSENGWSHKVGMDGEKLRVYTQGGSHRVQWTSAKGPGPALTWYKTYFDAPEGDAPVVLDLSTMSKGIAWVNGISIGRYWVSYLSPLGKPSQAEYHVPRPYLKPTDNLLVIFEEQGGNPDGISILYVRRDIICSVITEYHPPHVKSWQRQNSAIRAVVDDIKTKAHLKCPNHKVITSVDFASFGNPIGVCGSFTMGNCTSSSSQKVVEKYCLGKTECSIPIEREIFDKGNEGPCPEISKSLAVQVTCTDSNKNQE